MLRVAEAVVEVLEVVDALVEVVDGRSAEVREDAVVRAPGIPDFTIPISGSIFAAL